MKISIANHRHFSKLSSCPPAMRPPPGPRPGPPNRWVGRRAGTGSTRMALLLALRSHRIKTTSLDKGRAAGRGSVVPTVYTISPTNSTGPRNLLRRPVQRAAGRGGARPRKLARSGFDTRNLQPAYDANAPDASVPLGRPVRGGARRGGPRRGLRAEGCGQRARGGACRQALR